MNLAELIEIVLKSRRKTAGVFPLPDVDSCIDYAITEAGEYLDALLRERRRRDLRNNEKDHDARREWGQCGYMIASAIIQHDDAKRWDADCWIAEREPAFVGFYDVMLALCGARMLGDNSGIDELEALDYWHAFAVRCGWNPADLLSETCADFERKHLRAPSVYPVLSAEQAAA
jgi:hypothetical protein